MHLQKTSFRLVNLYQDSNYFNNPGQKPRHEVLNVAKQTGFGFFAIYQTYITFYPHPLLIL